MRYLIQMPRVPPINTDRARTLRRNATPAERQLWRLLAPYRPRFTRQLPVGPFIIDIACRQAKLAIELDGGHHSETIDADNKRTAFLESEGWTVMRVWNNELRAGADGVVEVILAKVEEITGVTPYRHERRQKLEE